MAVRQLGAAVARSTDIVTKAYIDAQATTITEYTSATGGGTSVALPTGFKGIFLTAIAGGGGGGSGNCAGGSSNRFGGGGGAGGNALFNCWIPASALGTTYSVTAPVVATGAALAGLGVANGTAGSDAGDVSFTSGTLTIKIPGGLGGAGATSAAHGSGGDGQIRTVGPGQFFGSYGGDGSSATGTSGNNSPLQELDANSIPYLMGFGGGAGGGGGAGANSAGTGGVAGGNGGSTPNGAGGTGGIRASATAPTSSAAPIAGQPGGGGGGGATLSTSAPTQAGGSALGYGGGGGGGAGGTSSAIGSGPGGNGGPCYICIEVVF